MKEKQTEYYQELNKLKLARKSFTGDCIALAFGGLFTIGLVVGDVTVSYNIFKEIYQKCEEANFPAFVKWFSSIAPTALIALLPGELIIDSGFETMSLFDSAKVGHNYMKEKKQNLLSLKKKK